MISISVKTPCCGMLMTFPKGGWVKNCPLCGKFFGVRESQGLLKDGIVIGSGRNVSGLEYNKKIKRWVPVK